MSLPAALHHLGPADGLLTVRTGRAGIAARAGHDLVLEVERWSATLDATSLTLTADAGSFRVREAGGGARPLDDGDRRQVVRNIAKVLDPARHPQITFASASVSPAGEDRLAVEGELRIAGAARTVRFDVRLEPQGDATVARGELAIDQTAFGLEPFSAFMGTLKVADTVVVSGEARLPAA